MQTTIVLAMNILCAFQVVCNYNVPSYYGHFSKNFFQIQSMTDGVFTYFQYHYRIDIDYQNTTIYFANTQKHCIQAFDLLNGKKRLIAGSYGKSGNKVGNINLMQFNSPKSVVYYRKSQASTIEQKQMQLYYAKNRTCNISESSCLTNSNSITIDNFNFYPPINLFPQTTSAEYLFISDTQNHCIKKINLSVKTSEVIAGLCGQEGFRDGISGFNRLRRPSSLGINKLGTIYFYDEGNQRMRKVSKTGKVQTLLNGACKQYFTTRQINNIALKAVLCYDNWIQQSAQTSQTDSNDLDICTEHSSKCS